MIDRLQHLILFPVALLITVSILTFSTLEIVFLGTNRLYIHYITGLYENLDENF